MHVASAPDARPFRTGRSFGFEPGRLKGTKARLKGNPFPFHRSNEPFQILPGGPLPPLPTGPRSDASHRYLSPRTIEIFPVGSMSWFEVVSMAVRPTVVLWSTVDQKSARRTRSKRTCWRASSHKKGREETKRRTKKRRRRKKSR